MCNKMSDVRLSNASPTLERVDARQPDNVRPPVRRNLFGSPDRNELRRYMTDTMQDGVRAFTEMYNFDPVNNRPLSPGNYVWQEDSSPPEFYLRPPHGNARPQREDDLPGDDRQDAAEENERQLVRPQTRDGSRKRPAGDSGDHSFLRLSRTFVLRCRRCLCRNAEARLCSELNRMQRFAGYV